MNEHEALTGSSSSECGEEGDDPDIEGLGGQRKKPRDLVVNTHVVNTCVQL